MRTFFDQYELKARLAPALFILFPLIFSGFSWFPELRTLSSTIISMLATCGVLKFLAKMARDAGKAKEERLFKEWGGKPTTILLRLRDDTLDPITKQRYHETLRGSIGLDFPKDIHHEDAHSDEYYESAIKWLREKTRDKNKYFLVFQDNVTYGFARNLWAMKPLGLPLSLIVVIANVVAVNYRFSSDISLVPPIILVSILISLGFVLSWVFYIKSNFVRSAAEAYARSLLACCEEIVLPPKKLLYQ